MNPESMGKVAALALKPLMRTMGLTDADMNDLWTAVANRMVDLRTLLHGGTITLPDGRQIQVAGLVAHDTAAIATDKRLRRIEALLDAVLDTHGIPKPAQISDAEPDGSDLPITEAEVVA